jgi:Ca-activated chloride channel family protein
VRQDRRTAAAAVLLAAWSVAWLDPHARARAGNRLYAEGKFDEAATTYNEALVDDPDSPRLHFNLGDAQYRQGKFDDALKAFRQIPTTDDDKARTSRVAYNAGNALYKLGAAAEASKPQEALGHWAEAIAAYRRALGADPENVDAKFNHEFVAKRLADLRKKLEEQQKEDEQKKQEQQQNQKPQDQQNQEQQKDQDQAQDQKQAEQPKPDQQEPPEPPKPQQAGAQPQDEKKPDGQQAADAAGGEKKPGEMSEQEATALLDGERNDEVRPDEIVRKLQGAGVAEPARDW